MGEVNPDVMAQLHRIHQAVNAGTLDKDTVNDALKLIHDYLTGAAYDDEPPEAFPDLSGELTKGDEGEHPAKRSRKKR